MLSTTFLSLGCSIVTRGSDYCYRFLDYICAQDFAKAYEMLADSIKAPETEKEREERIAEEEKEKEDGDRTLSLIDNYLGDKPTEKPMHKISATDAAHPKSRCGVFAGEAADQDLGIRF